MAKNAWRPNTATTPLAKAGAPTINAITGTSAIANAIANNARDIPCGFKRAMMAPMNPTSSTPGYIKLAGWSQPDRDTKAELNRRSQACEVLTGTGIRVAGNGQSGG